MINWKLKYWIKLISTIHYFNKNTVVFYFSFHTKYDKKWKLVKRTFDELFPIINGLFFNKKQWKICYYVTYIYGQSVSFSLLLSGCGHYTILRVNLDDGDVHLTFRSFMQKHLIRETLSFCTLYEYFETVYVSLPLIYITLNGITHNVWTLDVIAFTHTVIL